MARYTSKPHSADVLAAARAWREQALRASQSVFSHAPLWSSQNLSDLQSAFLGNPLAGPEPFHQKLTKQLDGTPGEIPKLAAECVWLLYLFGSSDAFGATQAREDSSTLAFPIKDARAKFRQA